MYGSKKWIANQMCSCVCGGTFSFASLNETVVTTAVDSLTPRRWFETQNAFKGALLEGGLIASYLRFTEIIFDHLKKIILGYFRLVFNFVKYEIWQPFILKIQ